MYGVERSVVMFPRLGIPVGSVEGRTRLAVNGRVGVGGDSTERLRAGFIVTFVVLSHAVCKIVNSWHELPWRHSDLVCIGLEL